MGYPPLYKTGAGLLFQIISSVTHKVPLCQTTNSERFPLTSVLVADVGHFVQENQAPLLLGQNSNGGFGQKQMDAPKAEHRWTAKVGQ
jgi:hypothetical protein